MPEERKVLGQVAPSATTETELYEVPALTSTVVSTVTVCNRDSAPATWRFSVSVGGGATANKDYLYYDNIIPPNETFAFTLGLTLGAGDILRVYASSGTLSFNIFGEEVS